MINNGPTIHLHSNEVDVRNYGKLYQVIFLQMTCHYYKMKQNFFKLLVLPIFDTLHLQNEVTLKSNFELDRNNI